MKPGTQRLCKTDSKFITATDIVNFGCRTMVQRTGIDLDLNVWSEPEKRRARHAHLRTPCP